MSDRCEKRTYDQWVRPYRCTRGAKFECEHDDGSWLKLCAQHAARYKKKGFAYRALLSSDEPRRQ